MAYNKYGGYCIPLSTRHRPAAQTVLCGKVWEPRTIEFILSHVGDGDIIHAGTYYGDFLPGLSRGCGLKARIWAFEPNPENYKCAAITLMINDLQNVTLTNAGVGESRGQLRMRVHDRSGIPLGGGSWIDEDSDQSGRETTTVDIVTIDETVPADRDISVIHLDVERFERAALSGALGTIARCKPIIILETLPEKRWLSENLFRIGYKEKFNLEGNTVLMPK